MLHEVIAVKPNDKYSYSVSEADFFLFDSLNEMIDAGVAARGKYAQGGSDGMLSDRGMRESGDWIGRHFTGWPEVRDSAKEPWQQGIDIIESMLRDLEHVELPKPASIRRQPIYSEDDGDEIDLDRLELSKPFWRTTRRALRVGQQTVTIVSGVTASCYRNWRDVLWRGASAIVLANVLENAGYRVELWGAQYALRAFDGSSKAMASACCVKGSSDPIDMATLAIALSGWFYRTVWFSTYCLSEHRPASGLGRPTNVTPIVPHITTDDKAFVIDDVFSRDDAMRFVRNVLGKFTLQAA